VWSYELLRELLQSTTGAGVQHPVAQEPLPLGADFRVAIRRTVRVGVNAGTIVEDLGIRPNVVHQMTRDDLLHGNRDLINKATKMLAALKPHGIKVMLEPGLGALPRVKVKTRNVTRLDLMVNDRPHRSFDVSHDVTEIDLPAILGDVARPLMLEFVCFEENRMVARQRISVP
jgi:hypothetical protein